ncbi:MAG TPA: response regulator transcription factor [Candidatus Aquicultor sp.]
MINLRVSLFHLLIVRLLTLLDVVFLLSIKISRASLTLLIVAFIYNLVLLVLWRRISNAIETRRYLFLIDLTVTASFIWFSCGFFSSPFFLYSLASIFLSSFFLKNMRYVVGSTLYFIALLNVGLLFDKAALGELIKNQDFDVLITSYMGIMTIAMISGYPACIVQRINKLRQDTASLRQEIQDTEAFISTITNPPVLSNREFEILTHISKGKSNQQISQDLFISEHTVKSHLHRIYKKLGISSREEAVIYYHSQSPRNGS